MFLKELLRSSVLCQAARGEIYGSGDRGRKDTNPGGPRAG